MKEVEKRAVELAKEGKNMSEIGQILNKEFNWVNGRPFKKSKLRIFCDDYTELFKHSWRFSKKHWKGLIAMSLILIGSEMEVLRKIDF